MALTFSELEAITRHYFMADNGKATDIYFNTSFLVNYLLKQQKGLWERPPGGDFIKIPLEYDGQEAGFYSKGDTLSSDDRQALTAARFDWKHAYSNGTITRIDTLKNAGEYAEVQLVVSRLVGAQKSLAKLLASCCYDDLTTASNRFGGLLACCNSSTTIPYGAIATDDLVAADGTKPWVGRRITTAENITLNIIRTMASTAKVSDGPGGKPNLVVTTETLWNIIADILQVQQRFVNGNETAKAGFPGLYFEGKEIFPDDFCPEGYAIAIKFQKVSR